VTCPKCRHTDYFLTNNAHHRLPYLTVFFGKASAWTVLRSSARGGQSPVIGCGVPFQRRDCCPDCGAALRLSAQWPPLHPRGLLASRRRHGANHRALNRQLSRLEGAHKSYAPKGARESRNGAASGTQGPRIVPTTAASAALRNVLIRGRNPGGQRRWPCLNMHI